jgi:hypothetical protein
LKKNYTKSGQDVLNFPIRLNDKLSGLYDVAASGQNPPSRQAREAFAELGAESDVQLARYKNIVAKDLPALNKLILDKQTPVISIKD